MRIKQFTIKSFKRFHNLTIQGIPETARLVVMTGPNGCGKSSVFDSFIVWHKKLLSRHIGFSYENQKDYYIKVGLPEVLNCNDLVDGLFDQPLPEDKNSLIKLFHFRSAYRNDADFAISNIQKIGEEIEQSRIQRFIDNDIAVSRNYQRLVADTLSALYGGNKDEITVKELRDELIGLIRESMLRVFDDLVLEGIGNTLENGTFLFTKGASNNFRYKNLSGGEKAAFDLLLDFVVKRQPYDNTIFCIDEPETHLNNRIQSKLLEELFQLVPDNCQLWIATHSIGMMRRARDIQEANPDKVVFLDFSDKDFDRPQILEPQPVNRTFWERTLKTTLDELSELIVPRKLVICEGNPVGTGNPKKTEFDARCYRTIFAEEFPDTQFLSGGGSNDVEADRFALIESIKALAKGVEIIRLVDRDDRSDQEVKELANKRIRVLSRRHIESYLFDDEILILLSQKSNQLSVASCILEAKKAAVSNSATRGNPEDDVKSAGGEIYNFIKKKLTLSGIGNTLDAFCRDTLAPLITPTTKVYAELKKDIFDL